jgi:hypothetical protein
MVGETELVKALGRHIGVDYISLADTVIDPAAAALIPETLARRYGVIPVRFEDDSLIVAMVDPGNVLVVDDVRGITSRRVARIATRADVEMPSAARAATTSPSRALPTWWAGTSRTTSARSAAVEEARSSSWSTPSSAGR